MGGQPLLVHREDAAVVPWHGRGRGRRGAAQLCFHQYDSVSSETLQEEVTLLWWHVPDSPFSLSSVKVEMKGPHDYSSPADWPLMMVRDNEQTCNTDR